MPIYEYICPTCGAFEEMQKVSEPALTHCPSGHAGVERKISAGGFILKGSGWYVTDYARKGANGNRATDTSDKSKAEGSTADAKGADKPASEAKAAAETKPATAGSDAGK